MSYVASFFPLSLSHGGHACGNFFSDPAKVSLSQKFIDGSSGALLRSSPRKSDARARAWRAYGFSDPLDIGWPEGPDASFFFLCRPSERHFVANGRFLAVLTPRIETDG